MQTVLFLSGGLSNYLYLCEIGNNKFKQVENEPRKILLRLYGENHHKNPSSLIKDVTTSVIMSDNKLGPTLYGLFSLGRLEEFINVRS
jgi:choline/ethanolamine kinase